MDQPREANGIKVKKACTGCRAAKAQCDMVYVISFGFIHTFSLHVYLLVVPAIVVKGKASDVLSSSGHATFVTVMDQIVHVQSHLLVMLMLIAI